jgi:diaminopimelate decarboxylase
MKLTFIRKPELECLCRDVPTPFHLYDEAMIRQRARQLKAAFSWNPGFREYFAVKANPNPALLGILMNEGFGLDCSSHTELRMAKAVGARGHDIMFSSNVTPEADMRLAAELGSLINLDDISHIDFLDRLAGIPETISLRFNPGDDFTIGNAIMSRPGDAKYGFTRSQLQDGIRDLQARGARRFSLHAFLSSNTTEAEYYPALARLLFETAVALNRECGAQIADINLSGGIGVPYHPDDADIDMMAVGRGVLSAFEEIMVPAGLGHVAIHTELGRWLLAPAGCLVSRVIHEKHIYKDYLGLDACAADLMRPVMHGDVVAAARVLYGEGESQRAITLERLLTQARRADRYRRETGRVHPFWGDGSLMSAALMRDPPGEPTMADEDYCACLAQVFEALISRDRAAQRGSAA